MTDGEDKEAVKHVGAIMMTFADMQVRRGMIPTRRSAFVYRMRAKDIEQVLEIRREKTPYERLKEICGQ